jgi:hypothetical protein
MPLTATDLIVTVGSASANSFATLAEAQTFHDYSLGSDAWFAAEEGDQVRALVKAARRLNQENWLGSRVSDTQALSWPRASAQKIDSAGGGYWDGFYGRASYLTTEIPQQIKDAQCLLALAMLNGWTGEIADGSVKTEIITGSVRRTIGPLSTALPSGVQSLLSGLTRGTTLERS